MKEAPPYYIEFENRGEYLYVLVGGELVTPEIAKLYWDQIAEKCDELNASKILIEKDFAQTVSAPEILEMGLYLGRILPGKKIAFFDRYSNKGVNELGKVIARNQGVQLRVFENVEDAEQWIAGD
jgi:hypothetical protein